MSMEAVNLKPKHPYDIQRDQLQVFNLVVPLLREEGLFDPVGILRKPCYLELLHNASMYPKSRLLSPIAISSIVTCHESILKKLNDPKFVLERKKSIQKIFAKSADLYTYQGVRPFVADDKEDVEFYELFLKGAIVLEEDCFFARAMLRKAWLKVNSKFRTLGFEKVFMEHELDRLVYQKNMIYAAALNEILRFL